MLVLCTVRAATRQNSNTEGGKPFGRLTIETDRPLQIHEITFFGSSMTDGTFDLLIRHVGKQVMLPLAMEEYKGKTSLRFPMGEKVDIRHDKSVSDKPSLTDKP